MKREAPLKRRSYVTVALWAVWEWGEGTSSQGQQTPANVFDTPKSILSASAITVLLHSW